MAFNAPLPEKSTTLFAPVASLPRKQYNEEFFISTGRLNDIADITLCKDRSKSQKPITGILLRYRGGRTACLGCFRFDQDKQQVRVEEGYGLQVGVRRTEQRYQYVAEVAVRSQSECQSWDDSEESWIGLHSEDVLVWYVSNRHCFVKKSSGNS